MKLLKKDPDLDGGDTFNVQTMLNDNWDKIDEAMGRAGVRPNLLTNAYFANPINQRGRTSYSGTGTYSIDGWYRGYDTSAVLTLEDGYIQFLGSENAELLQRIDGSLHLGRIMTASVLLSDNTMFWATAAMPSAYEGGYLNTDLLKTIPNTGGAAINLSYYEGRLRYIFICPAGSVVKPVAAKLEEGPDQTLAYQDADGKWKLLPQPDMDYGTQLAKCQRYQLDVNQTNYPATYIGPNVMEFFIPTPVTMRINPSVSIAPEIRIYSEKITDFAIAYYKAANGIKVIASKENHGVTNGYLSFLPGAILDANL